jgi:hypothetical protein
MEILNNHMTEKPMRYKDVFSDSIMLSDPTETSKVKNFPSKIEDIYELKIQDKNIDREKNLLNFFKFLETFN